MMKLFIKCGILNICCIMNFAAILLVANHWIFIKPIIIKISVYILMCLGIISTVFLFILSSKFDIYTIVLNNLYVVSFFIFCLCVLSSIIKIAILQLDRGSTLYDLYSFPAIFPIVSGMILLALKG